MTFGYKVFAEIIKLKWGRGKEVRAPDKENLA